MKRMKKMSMLLALTLAVTALPCGVSADEKDALPSDALSRQTAAVEADTSGSGAVDGAAADKAGKSEDTVTGSHLDADRAETADGAVGGSVETESEDDRNAVGKDGEDAVSTGQADAVGDDQENDADENGEDPAEENDAPVAAPQATVRLNTADHMKYMNGSSDGLFHPSSALTRAEAAQMIYSLLADTSEAEAVQNANFSDVSASAWYGQAVQSLVKYGVMNGYGSYFKPDAQISRAEFVKILSNFYELSAPAGSFSDVNDSHWAYEVILSAAAKGWINGYSDGTFHPDGTLSRAEAAAVINRVLSRSADVSTVNSADGIRIFPDVDSSHWAYLHIMEASISHDCEARSAGESESWTSFTREKTVLSPGTHVIQGVLYCVDEKTGDFVRNQYVDGHWYDASGKYVTGNSTLDALMRAATAASTTAGMTQHQMLQSTFNYVVNNFTYLKRAILSTGATGWETEYAVPMFQNHKGNCYSFAAVYYYLTKNIGYNPRTVAGLVGHNRRPHGWVEIDIGGKTYIYDPELTMAKRAAGYNYYLFEMTTGNAPFIYAKK